MNLENQYQMAKLAYENRNLAESYQLANTLISTGGDSEIIGKAWILKGLSCGGLSIPSNTRMGEMMSYIVEGVNLADLNTKDCLWLAQELSSLANGYASLLDSYYRNSNKKSLQSSKPRRVETINSNESFSESVGRDIGQAAADIVIGGAFNEVKTRKNSAVLGRQFLSSHAQDLKNIMEYAYALAPDDDNELVCSLLATSINTIVDINTLSPGARRKFTDSLDDLISLLVAEPNKGIYTL